MKRFVVTLLALLQCSSAAPAAHAPAVQPSSIGASAVDSALRGGGFVPGSSGWSLAGASAATDLTQTFAVGKARRTPTCANTAQEGQTLHAIDLKRWGIRNDGTAAKETTEGINNALQWAASQGITAVTLPSGTYLIDKDSHIRMVGNMLFQLPQDAILQKETNGKESYQLMVIGYGANHVTLRGGVYKGDKDTHDYSGKDSPHTSGTHELGYGILTLGADSVTIDGVKATHFTGDGLMIGAHGTLVKDLYENSFVSGGIDGNGKRTADKGRIRTVEPLKLDHPIFREQREFELTNPVHLPGQFDLFFYDKRGKFVRKLEGVKVRELIGIPDEAASFHLVFNKDNAKGAYIEFWNRTVTTNIVVKQSEFAYNRRQGITVGGADGVLIEGNSLHHIEGTAPQSGIDVEGGFGENGNRNSGIIIRGNRFYDNASYDIVLYDGEDAVVEHNHLASKGAIGLAVSVPFTGALVRNNHFDGTRISAHHDATFVDNRMTEGSTFFEGPRIRIEGMDMTDSVLHISAKQPYGVTASRITIRSTGTEKAAGLALYGKRIRLNDITIEGPSSLRTVTGSIEPGSVINRLKVTGFHADYGIALPPATYNDCEFEGAKGGSHGFIGLTNAGTYQFNRCKFTSSETASHNIVAANGKLDLIIRNSVFEAKGNSSAVSVEAAGSVLLENNAIRALALTSEETELIKLNDYWKREEPYDIGSAVIRGNTITSNLAAVGISTVYAGIGAPPYIVEDNTLNKAALRLKDNDKASGNVTK